MAGSREVRAGSETRTMWGLGIILIVIIIVIIIVITIIIIIIIIELIIVIIMIVMTITMIIVGFGVSGFSLAFPSAPRDPFPLEQVSKH